MALPFSLGDVLPHIRRLPASSRLMVFQRMVQVADERGLDEVPGLIESCTTFIDHELRVIAVRGAREDEPTRQHDVVAPILDQQLDNMVAGLHAFLVTHTRTHPPPHQRGALAQRLLERLYPSGLAAVVNATYVEEHAMVQVMGRHIEATPEDADALDELGLSDLFLEILELNETYGAALHPPVPVDPDRSLREIERMGMSNLMGAITMICGRFPNDADPDHIEARQAYLDLYVQRRNAAKEALRQSRRGSRTPSADEEPDADDLGVEEPEAPMPPMDDCAEDAA